MQKVHENQRIKETLAMLAAGKTKEEIAEHYNHKSWKAIDMYFRRRGFVWDGATYVLPQEESTIVDETSDSQGKATQIIQEIGQHHADIEVVAQKHGFSTIEELGKFMKCQGYLWNYKKNSYEYKQRETESKQDQKGTIVGTYHELLSLLNTHKDKLIQLLEASPDKTLLLHKFKGTKTNKTLGMAKELQQLLVNYSNEFNITQRDIVEIALAEFFQKYGYEKKLKQITFD